MKTTGDFLPGETDRNLVQKADPFAGSSGSGTASVLASNRRNFVSIQIHSSLIPTLQSVFNCPSRTMRSMASRLAHSECTGRRLSFDAGALSFVQDDGKKNFRTAEKKTGAHFNGAFVG